MASQNLIINADDWGRDRPTTDRTLDCVRRKAVTRTSAMVFMEDSQRAADLACELHIDTGLHLNLTTPFSEANCKEELRQHHDRVMRYLRRHFLNRAILNPLLANSFEYVVLAQLDEYQKLYGSNPVRIDGHHHMHLCANVTLGGLLPHGMIVRRNFSPEPGEKNFLARVLRNVQDRWLEKRYETTDYFFSLPPLIPRERLHRIFVIAESHTVEVETHPIIPEEYEFLMSDTIRSLIMQVVNGLESTANRQTLTTGHSCGSSSGDQIYAD